MLLSLVASALAAATPTPLPAWRWPAGEVQRFHIETEIVTPRGTRYYASKNLDARAGTVKVRADVACTGAPEGKGTFLECSFAYVDVKGLPWVADEEQELNSILAEWTENLAKTKVEMELAPDGRMRTFDTKGGMTRSNQREGSIIEQQRTLLQRTFCGFDLPLTTDQKDWIRGWKQKATSSILQLQTVSGTAGAFDMTHKHNGEDDGGLTIIDTEARATLSVGYAVDADQGARLVDVRLAGQTLFDAQRGMMMWRDFTMDGRLTVSAQEAGSSAEYFQQTAMQWVPEFPEPGEIPLTLAAQRAPKFDGTAPALPEGVALVPFAELGMQALYVQGLPEDAKPLSLPATKVKARVVVGTDGMPRSITAYEGYKVLGKATEDALLGAKFPARAANYAVDVEVEWRP